MAAQNLFFVLAITAIVSALGMLTSKNPVNSALWLILNLFCVAGLYLTVNAEFIAVVQVLVYAGAIMVLFLFVIMLLNLSALPELGRIDWRRMIAFALGMGVLAQLSYIVASSLDMLPDPATLETAADTGSATALASVLFTEYVLPFEAIGILLLAATVGAVVLAKRRPV
ncbi:MAG: NADH-quinone oxidoreductase subunit J [Rhodothermales bacterium]|nr:NADH-quinone oxidoreductase subunit J [Rhodothermales bacterium]